MRQWIRWRSATEYTDTFHTEKKKEKYTLYFVSLSFRFEPGYSEWKFFSAYFYLVLSRIMVWINFCPVLELTECFGRHLKPLVPCANTAVWASCTRNGSLTRTQSEAHTKSGNGHRRTQTWIFMFMKDPTLYTCITLFCGGSVQLARHISWLYPWIRQRNGNKNRQLIKM